MRAIAILTYILFTSSVASSHEGAMYFVPGLSDESIKAIDLNDGSLEDWSRIIDPSFSLKHNDFLPDRNGSHINSTDLEFTLYIAWNKNSKRIYVGFQKDDDIYIKQDFNYQFNPIGLNDSSIEFMIDGDHSGGEYGYSNDCCSTDNEWAERHNSQAQYYLGSASAMGEQHLSYMGSGTNWITTFPYANSGGLVATQEGRTRSVVEFYITPFNEVINENPTESQESTLEYEDIIGFQVSVPDFDDITGLPQSFHTLSNEPSTWRNADRFADGFLLEYDPFSLMIGHCFSLTDSDCDGVPDAQADSTTAITEQAWARIKASLKEYNH